MHLTEVQKDDVKVNKDIAAFSYIWIFSVVILWSRRDSQFIQFHAKQAVVLFIFSVVFYLIPIPKFEYMNVFVAAGMITGFINANMGQYYEMPLVSDIVKHHITVDGMWDFVKEKWRYCGNFVKRVFKKGPRVVVESGVDTISKIRGVDVLKVNSKVGELEKSVQALMMEKKALELQMANLEVEALSNKYLRNLNFLDSPNNVQAFANEIIKQVNLKNLKLTQEDFSQYIVFRSREGKPVFIIGNFSPESLALFISNSTVRDFKNYAVNLNSWHGIRVGEMGKEVKKVLNLLV